MKFLPLYDQSACAPCLSSWLLNLLANIDKLCQGAKGLQAMKFLQVSSKQETVLRMES